MADDGVSGICGLEQSNGDVALPGKQERQRGRETGSDCLTQVKPGERGAPHDGVRQNHSNVLARVACAAMRRLCDSQALTALGALHHYATEHWKMKSGFRVGVSSKGPEDSPSPPLTVPYSLYGIQSA